MDIAAPSLRESPSRGRPLQPELQAPVSRPDLAALDYKGWIDRLRTDPAYHGKDPAILYRYVTRRPEFRGSDESAMLDVSIDQGPRFRAFEERDAQFIDSLFKQRQEGITLCGLSDTWRHFSLNKGVPDHQAVSPKLYVTLKDPTSPNFDFDLLKRLVIELGKQGVNGQAKYTCDGARMACSNDNIVVHGRDDDDIGIAERVVRYVMGESLQTTWKGLDVERRSYGQLCAQWVAKNQGTQKISAAPATSLGEYNNRTAPEMPPLAPGMARLFRGETNGSVLGEEFTPERKPLDPNHWASTDAAVIGAYEAEGRWFSTDSTKALYYQSHFGGGRPITYVDVPAQCVDQWRASNQSAGDFSAGGRQGELARQEIFVPREVADGRKWARIS